MFLFLKILPYLFLFVGFQGWQVCCCCTASKLEYHEYTLKTANHEAALCCYNNGYHFMNKYPDVWGDSAILLERFMKTFFFLITLCSSSYSFGTSACLPDSTFDTNTVAMHTELHHILLHSWTHCHFLELIANICRIPIVNYTGELPALSLLLVFSVRIIRCP